MGVQFTSPPYAFPNTHHMRSSRQQPIRTGSIPWMPQLHHKIPSNRNASTIEKLDLCIRRQVRNLSDSDGNPSLLPLRLQAIQNLGNRLSLV